MAHSRQGGSDLHWSRHKPPIRTGPRKQQAGLEECREEAVPVLRQEFSESSATDRSRSQSGLTPYERCSSARWHDQMCF